MSRRWTAKCWMGSSSGYVDLEVSAATLNGAKEQLQNIYGAQQIINLREISNRGGGGSSSDSGAMMGLALIAGIIYLVVTYWPIALGLLVLYILYKIFV
jgi:hypothetical protein